ncbi:hypothetical protein Tco_1047460 [Tanacetum coccineum]
MTMKKVGDQTIGVIWRRRIDKEGNVSRSSITPNGRPKEQVFTLPITTTKGNMNGWLIDDANDSDLESTASNQPMSLTMEDIVTNNLNNGNGNGNGGGNNGCTYKGFVACGPQDFDGTDAANAMACDDFKALLTTEFYLRNEIEMLEGEFWNHSMVGADHAGYTNRFHELAKLVPHLVTPETKLAILTAGILTDEAVHNGTLAKAGEKRKERDLFGQVTHHRERQFCLSRRRMDRFACT